jgi:hypothetical protein
VPEPSVFEVEMTIEKSKRYKSPGIDRIPAELLKAGDSKVYSQIHKSINSVWNKEKLPEQWKGQSLYIFIRRVIKQILVIIVAYHSCQLHTKFHQTFFYQS